jgi:hypothetical protein
MNIPFTKIARDIERKRIIAVLQSEEAFEAVYYNEMGADGALGDLIALIEKSK